MYWTDDTPADDNKYSRSMVDVSIRIECQQIPADHIDTLTQELLKKLPWLSEVENSAVHQIYIPVSANGWERDPTARDTILHLPKRTRLRIRVDKNYVDKMQALEGQSINIDGYTLKFGKMKTLPISSSEILVSRFVYIPQTEDNEEKFLEIAYQQLRQKDVVIKKMLCGKTSQFSLQGKTIKTRSLMLADLKREDSIILQESGIGEYNLYGCGIFIPQKGIKAVNQE